MTGFVGKERTGEDLSMESDAALLSLTTGFSMVPAGKEEPVTLPFPAVLFMATSLDEVVRGEISFTVMEGLFPGFAVAVCVSADTGRRGDTVVVTPPAQEETGNFLDRCSQGTHLWYQAVPINATRMLLRIAIRRIPARNPGVSCPRARKDRLRPGSALRKTSAGLGARF